MELRAETSVFDDKLLKEDVDNAQQTADNAQVIAGTTAQYFWFLEEIGSVPAGVGTGAHITNLTKEEFLNNPANGGGNLLARSNGIAIRDGLTELAIFSADQLRIGKANAQRAVVNSGSLELYDAQNNKYFMVSANGLSYGSHVVATQEDIADIEGQVDTATSSTAVKTQYYLSTSASSATGGSWQDTVPTWSTGKYIWTRVATTKTTIGGTSSTSYSTAVYDRALTTALSTSESAQSSANSGASTVTTTQQFYLSTSSSSATGGSWSDSAPTWSTGHYIWTRYKIVKTTVGGTTSTSYTTGIYDKTLTDALSSAEEAAKTATNYMFVDGNGALNIASANPSTATRKVNISADGIKIQNDANNYALVESSGMDIYQGGNSVASFGATARIGKPTDANTGNVYIDNNSVNIRKGSTVLSTFTDSGASIGCNSTTAAIDLLANSLKISGRYETLISTNDTFVTEIMNQSSSSIKYMDVGVKNGGYLRATDSGVYLWVDGASQSTYIGLSSYGGITLHSGGNTGSTDFKLEGYGVVYNTYDINDATISVALSYEDASISYMNGTSIGAAEPSSPYLHGLYSDSLVDWIIGLDGDSEKVFSPQIYTKTTSSGANVRVVTSGKGYLYRYVSSSRRYKEDIEELVNSELDAKRLYDLRPVQFRYKEGYLEPDDPRCGKLVSGFIAEEVEEAYPIAVQYENEMVEDWEPKFIIPPMLKLIQEQNDRIAELERRLL